MTDSEYQTALEKLNQVKKTSEAIGAIKALQELGQLVMTRAGSGIGEEAVIQLAWVFKEICNLSDSLDRQLESGSQRSPEPH